MVTLLRNRVQQSTLLKWSTFFRSDYYRSFASFATEERFCAWHLGAPDWFKKGGGWSE